MHLSHLYGPQNNLLLFVNEQSHRRCSESPFTPQRGQTEKPSRAGGNQRSEVRKLEGGREVTIRHCSCAARWEICCHKLVWVGCCCQWRWIWCNLKKAVVDLWRPPPGHINKLWRYCLSQRGFKIINLVQETPRNMLSDCVWKHLQHDSDGFYFDILHK